MWYRYRFHLLAVAAVAGGSTAFSLLLQYRFGFDPCVMCIVQRMGILFAGLAALFAACLPLHKRGVRTAAAVLPSLPALYAAWTAVRQIHLQSLPVHEQPSCGAPWTFRLKDWWLFDWYEPLIRGFGQCGAVEKFLGLPLPVWGLSVCLLMLALLWGGWFVAGRRRV